MDGIIEKKAVKINYTIMDDKEYYSLMNRSSSWALQEALKKARKDKTRNRK